MLRDSVCKFCIEADGDEAVTRFDRWPISAPPTPMACAIDSFVAEGADTEGTDTEGTDALEGVVVDPGGTEGAGPVAAGAASAVETAGEGDGDVVGANVAEGAGVGLESTAKATPARPGPAMRPAAKTAVPRTCRRGR
ncbi:hypothetical protein GCM10009712_31890 [Pseudarthrobacter sulfonivorans]